MSIATTPHVTNVSTRPPATAVSPVALVSAIPTKVFARPISVGIHGTQASTTPQRKRFFFWSSTGWLRPCLLPHRPFCRDVAACWSCQYPCPPQLLHRTLPTQRHLH